MKLELWGILAGIHSEQKSTSPRQWYWEGKKRRANLESLSRKNLLDGEKNVCNYFCELACVACADGWEGRARKCAAVSSSSAATVSDIQQRSISAALHNIYKHSSYFLKALFRVPAAPTPTPTATSFVRAQRKISSSENCSIQGVWSLSSRPITRDEACAVDF